MLYTVDEVAEKLNVHPATVHKLIAHGTLEALRVGSLVRISTDSLQAFLDAAKIGKPRVKP